MNLNILWFILIAVLYVGFFFLEGFDFGVGMLLPVVGKTDLDRRVFRVHETVPVTPGPSDPKGHQLRATAPELIQKTVDLMTKYI